MKTNQRSNGNRPNSNRRGQPPNRSKQSVNSRLSGVRSRIGKPKVDLRQMLKSKGATTKSSLNNKASTSAAASGSNVKSRLGLQSATARLEAMKEARAQLSSIKNKKTAPKDLKSQTQLKRTIQSSAVTKTTRPDTVRSQATIRKGNNTLIRQDRDRLLKDRNSTARRPLDRGGNLKSDSFRGRSERNVGIKSVTTQPIIIPQYIPTAQPIVYQQPSHSSYDNTATRYINRSEAAPSVMSSMGNSVLVSNLSAKITEDEVAELFGDIGPLMNVQIINSTTALVTYFASQHASKAVKVYNYRLLDGIAMNCTILPSATPATPSTISTTSQQPASHSLYSGRMYADSIPASRGNLRSNYHLGL